MGLDGAPCHLELLGDFCVVAALQQQIGDLLLARGEPNKRFLHRSPWKSNGLPQATLRPARQGESSPLQTRSRIQKFWIRPYRIP
jgi:hypothetical protein